MLKYNNKVLRVRQKENWVWKIYLGKRTRIFITLSARIIRIKKKKNIRQIKSAVFDFWRSRLSVG